MSAEAVAAYVEDYLPEDEPLLTARRNAQQAGGTPTVSPATGALLRFIAAALAARSVVEVGTGCGTSGVWLLRGMRPDGVLTSVDVDPENQRLAREVFSLAGFASNRYRLIGGKATDVLPRLTDGAYDLVFCDADQHEYPTYLSAALRLLRPGGGLAFAHALAWSPGADEGRTDAEALAVREVCDLVRNDDRLDPVLVPVGSGLLAAVKRA